MAMNQIAVELSGGRNRSRTCDLFLVMEALVPTELCALRGSLAYTIRSQPFDHILTPLHLRVCIRFVQCALAVCIKASRAGILCAPGVVSTKHALESPCETEGRLPGFPRLTPRFSPAEAAMPLPELGRVARLRTNPDTVPPDRKGHAAFRTSRKRPTLDQCDRREASRPELQSCYPPQRIRHRHGQRDPDSRIRGGSTNP